MAWSKRPKANRKAVKRGKKLSSDSEKKGGQSRPRSWARTGRSALQRWHDAEANETATGDRW